MDITRNPLWGRTRDLSILSRQSRLSMSKRLRASCDSIRRSCEKRRGTGRCLPPKSVSGGCLSKQTLSSGFDANTLRTGKRRQVAPRR